MHLAELALQSPVLVALITTVAALVGGRVLIQAKDERIASMREAHAAELRAKDAEIAAIERLTPARMQEYVQASIQVFESRIEQLTGERDDLKAKLSDAIGLDADQRRELETELKLTGAHLALTEGAWTAAKETAEKSTS